MKTTVSVFDAQQNKQLEINSRLGMKLCISYPARFTLNYQSSLNHIHRDEIFTESRSIIMPQLPKETVVFPNGAHTVVAFEVKTTNGTYGPQEEITCMKEGGQGEMTRVWISHSGLKKIKQAQEIGLVEIHENESWEVVIGARIQILVAGGKVVGFAKPPKTE